MGANVWDESKFVVEKQYWSGTKKINGTVDNAAVVDNGDGTVQIPITAHGMSEGNFIILAGTTNYNGVHEIVSLDTDYINITATYAAENLAGTETYKNCFQINPNIQDYQILEIRLTLSAVGGAAEAYSIDLDSAQGAAWDVQLDTEANMTAVQYSIWKAWTERRYFNGGDIITFSYANTNSKTWGIELIYRRQS